MYQIIMDKKTKKYNSQAPKQSISRTIIEKSNHLSPFHAPLQPKMFFSKKSSMNAIENVPKNNNTGLPDKLKSGIESLSGFNMDDVRIHYNSSRPAQLQALAYTQGTEIHIAPGQEKHLAHEAWHVVQQKQGRVSPNMQIRGMSVNDDMALEHEADVMGKKAASSDFHRQIQLKRNPHSCIQRIVKYCGREYSGSGDNNIGKGTFNGDVVLKNFYRSHGPFKIAMEDSIHEFDLDAQLRDLDSAIILKIEKDYQPKDYFVIDARNPKDCYMRRAQGRLNYNVNGVMINAVKELYKAGKNDKLSNIFIDYHLPRIINAMRTDYTFVLVPPGETDITGKVQNRFEYKMDNKKVESSGGGTHYIYRAMNMEQAKKLEQKWNGWKSNFPVDIPGDLNPQEIGLMNHMGSFDQAFCTYTLGIPVEFEMKPGITPSALLACYDITGREREASNREGISPSNGKLGIKTESQGGNFSFLLSSRMSSGENAKAVVWNFLSKVANIKVYYIRPENPVT